MQGESQREMEKEEELVVAAQISIARQISVSQRQMLLPVVPEGCRMVGREGVPEEEAVVVAPRALRPRLVNHRASREAIAA